MIEFNLEQALIGKPVETKDGNKIFGCKLKGNIIEVSFGGEPAKYTLQEAIEYLCMAEEEMYIRLTECEIDEKRIKDFTFIDDHPMHDKSKFRIFKLVEVKEK